MKFSFVAIQDWPKVHAAFCRWLPDVWRDPKMFYTVLSQATSATFEFGIGEAYVVLTNITIGHKAVIHEVVLGKQFLGRPDLAKEVCRALMDLYRLERLEGYVDVHNRLAGRYNERLGFHMEGIRRKAEIYNGEATDVAVYGLLKEELL